MAQHGQRDVAVASHGKPLARLEIVLTHETIGRIEEIVVLDEAAIWLVGDRLVREPRLTLIEGARLFSRTPSGIFLMYLLPAAAAGWMVKLANRQSHTLIKGQQGALRNLLITLTSGSQGELQRGDVRLSYKVVPCEP